MGRKDAAVVLATDGSVTMACTGLPPSCFLLCKNLQNLGVKQRLGAREVLIDYHRGGLTFLERPTQLPRIQQYVRPCERQWALWSNRFSTVETLGWLVPISILLSANFS